MLIAALILSHPLTIPVILSTHTQTRAQLTEHNRNPPLPLDLDVPYNDDFSVYERDDNLVPPPSAPSQPPFVMQAGIVPRAGFKPPLPPPRKTTILISDYNNPNSDYNLRLNHSSGGGRGNHIIGNVATGGTPPTLASSGPGGEQPNSGSGGSSQRPSHKTHVEIITKHGATKKPNIIGNNYHPPSQPKYTDELTIKWTVNSNATNNETEPTRPYTPPHGRSNPNLDGENSGGPTTSARAENRKVTCMLYLQADHTFFDKMGSEEASIDAITRHVQRANVIYKGTGE